VSTLRLLLVDDDAWTESLVASVLGKRGYDLHIARSVAQAKELLAEQRFDVIITDALLSSGEEAGAALFRELPAAREAAILLLTALPAHDPRVRAVAGDGYLGKPFRFVDLDHAVERTLQFQKRRAAAAAVPERGEGGPAGAPLRSGIHGTLDQIGLGSLLTMIEMERKSGILLLRRGNSSARLYCKDGRVLMARLFGATPMSGADVVYRLLKWTDGHFNFTATTVSVPDEIGLRITHLLLEGARRHDEASPEGR
jgi:CheY-like chemotaxis protein